MLRVPGDSGGRQLARQAWSRHLRVLQALRKTLDFTTRQWDITERFLFLLEKHCVSVQSQKYSDIIHSIIPLLLSQSQLLEFLHQSHSDWYPDP